jgi:subtilisin family serine protease
MRLETIILRGPRAAMPDLVAKTGSIELTAAGASEPPEAFSLEVRDANPVEVHDLSRDPDILQTAPVMPVELIRPTDESASQQSGQQGVCWGVEAVGATLSKRTGAGVTVALLDTGIIADHPAFIHMTPRPEVENFTSDPDIDENGHGTHCAGTIFGQDVAQTRIGVAPGISRVLVAKVIGRNGGGSTQAIFKAMLWAQQRGAHVISMSLGMDFPGYQKRLMDYGLPAVKATSMALAGYRANIRLFDKLSQLTAGQDGLVGGSVVVAAAGNESSRPDYSITVAPPAAAVLFLSVGAIARPDEKGYAVARFSNDGVNLVAPGVDILSADLGSGLTSKSGTSMAVPHVAGVAALWAEELMATKAFNAAAVVDLIKRHAVPLPLPEIDVGVGLIRAPVGQ